MNDDYYLEMRSQELLRILYNRNLIIENIKFSIKEITPNLRIVELLDYYDFESNVKKLLDYLVTTGEIDSPIENYYMIKNKNK